MQRYEYKVVPAPRKGQRGKGVKGTEGKFAHALQLLMNQHGLDGWEYQRTDTLPCEERVGLTGRTTTFQNMLVFRRPLAAEQPQDMPILLEHKSTASEAKPDPEPETAEDPPKIDEIKPVAEGKAPKVGGVHKDDPGKTASAPDVAAQ